MVLIYDGILAGREPAAVTLAALRNGVASPPPLIDTPLRRDSMSLIHGLLRAPTLRNQQLKYPFSFVGYFLH